MMRRLTVALLSAAALTGCGSQSAADEGKLGVVTAFYPLQFISERIGGAQAGVTNLTKPGAEPHDLELNPRQVGEIVEADLVVYLKGFQPAVDDAVRQEAGDRAFDAATAVELLPAEHEDEHGHEEGAEEEHADEKGALDPHLWLDPTRLATVADKLAERLGKADPEHAAAYTERAAALRTELTALDAEYAAKLKTCARRELVTSHTAFHYLADRYQLKQIGISGLSPETEPSAARMAEVAEQAKAAKATTIFFETLVSPKVAETVAREIGAKTAVLDPLEGLNEQGGDYFSVMRANLSALTTALECK